jgi:hypothetical protein
MSPHRKLDWFRERGYTTAEIEHLKNLVTERWNESYRHLDLGSEDVTPDTSFTTATEGRSSNPLAALGTRVTYRFSHLLNLF